MKVSICLLLALAIVLDAEGARILGVWPIPSRSHFHLGNRLFGELSKKGHEVTLITPYPQDESLQGIRVISNEEILLQVSEMQRDLLEEGQKNLFAHMKYVIEFMNILTETTLKTKGVQNLIHSNEKFDVVIIEQYFNEAYLGLGYHFNCPVVLISPMPGGWADYMFSNPRPSSYVPNLMSRFGRNMNLLERMENFVYDIFEQINTHWSNLPRNEKLLKKYIPNAPSIYDLVYNASLLLVNSHPSINEPIPHVPAVIEIGGYHISEPKPLPNDIKKFLDNAKEGVVLFALGSNLKSSTLPKHLRKAFLSGLSKIKEKVLWKFEEDLSDKPDNVMIKDWLPQNDILGHPNVKAFISHGGLKQFIMEFLS